MKVLILKGVFLNTYFPGAPRYKSMKNYFPKNNDLCLYYCLHKCIEKNEENKIRRPDVIINKGGLADKYILISLGKKNEKKDLNINVT